MARAVRMTVFVLVKDDLQPPSKTIGKPAERRKTWNMIASFEPGDHRLSHPDALGELLLRFATTLTQIKQATSTLRRYDRTVVETSFRTNGRLSHCENLAILLSSVKSRCKTNAAADFMAMYDCIERCKERDGL